MGAGATADEDPRSVAGGGLPAPDFAPAALGPACYP